MAEKGVKEVDWVKMDGNDQKCLELLEISKIGWKWLKCLKIADNDWKCMDDVKHLNPSFLTSFAQHNNLEVLFWKFGACKSKYALKALLSQNLLHFTLKKKKNKSVYHSKVFLGHLR